MAHSQETAEAVAAPSTLSMEDAASVFADPVEETVEQTEAQHEEVAQDEIVEAEDEALDYETDEESEEQEDPAIDAPVSLNADEKEAFAAATPEVQQAWAAAETRRNTQVQEATTRAKEAQRAAEQQAAQVEREADARYGEQLRQFTANFEPQMPDPSRYHDMQSFQRDKAIYDHQKAQYDQLMQQVSVVGVETDEQKAERIKARDAELMQIPEIANEETRNDYIRTAMSMAGEFGYDVNTLLETIDASDMRNLAQAAQWKADSKELAQIKSKAKARRRDKSTGRFKSLKPGAAQPIQGGSDPQADKRKQTFKDNPNDMKAAAAVFG